MPTFGEFVRKLALLAAADGRKVDGPLPVAHDSAPLHLTRSAGSEAELLLNRSAGLHGLHRRTTHGLDQHFTLQSERCGLWPAAARAGARRARARPSAVPSVQFLLRMSEPTFYADLDALFAVAGLNASLRHAFFPGRSSASHRTHASAQVRRFYDRELARLALRLYAQDYDAFGLPRPNVDSFRS